MGTLMETTEVKLLADKYRKRQAESAVYSAMSAPTDAYYSDTVHTIAINTRETEFGSIVEPIPIMLQTYQPIQPNAGHAVVYGYPPQLVAPYTSTVRIPEVETPSTSTTPIRVKDEGKEEKIARPPKKKWIKEYLEEEPKSPVSLRVTGVSVTRGNSVLRPATPPIAPAPIPVSVLVTAPPPHLPPLPPLEPAPAPAPVVPLPVPALVPVSHHPAPIDFIQEHSRPRNTNGHGPPQIPSPSSVGSNSSTGSVPRAGTREVHNKLEKNRRAHLKECFELLKRQLPATPEDKKTSNLSILGSAIRYIQVLRRKERECEHEMERLAREKIAAQQRLAALKREVSLRSTFRPRTIDVTIEEDEDDDMIGPVIGIPLNIPPLTRMDSPPRSLNLSTKLRSLPIQITPSTSQMVGPGGLVLGPSLQLLPPGLRLIHSGVSTDSNKNTRDNGSASSPSTSTEGVVVSGMPPLVLSPPHTHTHTHVLHTHTRTHKVTQ